MTECKQTLRLAALQAAGQIRSLEQQQALLTEAKRDLNSQLDRVELEASRADRQRQNAVERCTSLQKQCHNLQEMLMAHAPQQLEGKLQVHARHKSYKLGRGDRIQAHLPGQDIL